MDDKTRYIDEILSYCEVLEYSNPSVLELTDEKLSEKELHNILYMLRYNFPEDLTLLVLKNLLHYSDFNKIINAFVSDFIDNKLLYDCAKSGDLTKVEQALSDISRKKANFMQDLVSGQLFCNRNVRELMDINHIIYIEHRFNWKNHEFSFVLSNGTNSVCFPMPEIQLIGGCWSMDVAKRLLVGQIYLQSVFRIAKSSLELDFKLHRVDCDVVACDNCFYAPLWYSAFNEVSKTETGARARVFIDFLKNEYPKSYEWLEQNSGDKNYYTDFYDKMC